MTAHPLLLPSGPVDLTALPTDATSGFKGGKRAGRKALDKLGPELAELQERLFAQGRSGEGADAQRRVLLVLQGMDTSGKGGVLRHTVGLVDPQGVRISSFKAPTEEELSHDFLWRIRRALPEPGYLGVFDRSHYEDVLIARVDGLAEPDEIERRYDAINEFEAELVEQGVVIVKCLLHISPEEQKRRLLARLDDPTKHWKYHSSDLASTSRAGPTTAGPTRSPSSTRTPRTRRGTSSPATTSGTATWWSASCCSTTLRSMQLEWPVADFDVNAERARLIGEKPIT